MNSAGKKSLAMVRITIVVAAMDPTVDRSPLQWRSWNPHTNRKPAIGRLQKSEAHVEERMEVIVIAGYITYEKMHIARDYLEKIAREACGVKPEQIDEKNIKVMKKEDCFQKNLIDDEEVKRRLQK
ncbi:hypothetical protein V6N12_037516 [Hibiscus sabdariffa]|uniref:Uncharacterized protein n=1 Tax=Hibiscus sabdariffa TaxID=183260 RepID=A0ABR2AI39_9ROSI